MNTTATECQSMGTADDRLVLKTGPEEHREVQEVDRISGDEPIETEIMDMSSDCQSVVDTEISTEMMRPALDERPVTTVTDSADTNACDTNVCKQLALIRILVNVCNFFQSIDMTATECLSVSVADEPLLLTIGAHVLVTYNGVILFNL